MTGEREALLSQAHFTHPGFEQIMTTSELQRLIDERAPRLEAVRKGTVVDVKWKRIAPGRFKVWLQGR